MTKLEVGMAHKLCPRSRKALMAARLLMAAAMAVFCGLLSGCPIERSLEDSLGQENIILLKNNCEQSIFFSVTGFTEEIYSRRGAGEFNTATRQEVTSNGTSVYSWLIR